MIDKITELSAKKAEERKTDSSAAEKMKEAAKGQAPRFLVISPIHRSSQDLQVFQFGQGDAFHATRVGRCILPPPDDSPFLFAGPAAYNKHFPDKTGVILTFDVEESGEVVRKSIENAAQHQDLKDIPFLAFRIDYERGDARPIAHGFDRAYELENYILKRLSRPDLVDEDTLVVVCSDSRVVPPVTPNGVPMAIQTLGAHLPAYDEDLEELVQLDGFFEDWVSRESDERRIIVVVHGNFEGEGSSCGAGEASLSPSTIDQDDLKPVIERIQLDASEIEELPAKTPEERVVSIGKVTLANLLTYPSLAAALKKGLLHRDFMRVLQMDTVTNVISPYKIDPL